MSRIFATLSVVALSLLGITLGLGMTAGDYNGISTEYRTAQRATQTVSTSDRASPTSEQLALGEITSRLEAIQARNGRHTQFGLLATIVTVMVNSISVTYFIGTSRWSKEVSDTYRLDPLLDARANRLKKSTFPWSILGITTVLIIAAFGAAADPGTLRETTQDWVLPHFYIAMLGVGVIAYALFRQYEVLCQNHVLIGEILEAVRVIRTEKGLDVEPAAVS